MITELVLRKGKEEGPQQRRWRGNEKETGEREISAEEEELEAARELQEKEDESNAEPMMQDVFNLLCGHFMIQLVWSLITVTNNIIKNI